MMCVIGYFFLSYTVVVFIMALLISLPEGEVHRTFNFRGKNIPKRPLIASVVPFMPLIPYAWVAVQTLLFAGMFRPVVVRALVEDGYTEKVRAVRVLWATPMAAHLYVVQDCSTLPGKGRSSGWTVDIIRVGGKWRSRNAPDIVWTDCANAEGNIFPPYVEGF